MRYKVIKLQKKCLKGICLCAFLYIYVFFCHFMFNFVLITII